MHSTKTNIARPTDDAALVRLGVVVGGRLVEEQVSRAREITVGQRAGCTLIVPSDALPARWRLFERHRGAYRLRLTPSMNGRIARGTEVMTTPPADAGTAPVRTYALRARTRGKIAAGEVTILFQVLPAPPPRPRPQLPPSLRGSLLGQLDGLFSVVAVASLIAHLAMVIYLRGVDWPRRPDIEEVPDHFVRQVIRPRPLPPALPPPPVETPAVAKTPAPPRPAPRPRPAPARPPSPSPSPEEYRASLARQASRVGILQVLSALGPDGAARDLLSRGSVDREQEEALRSVGGLQVASEGTPAHLARADRGGGGGRIADVGDLRGTPGISAADVAGPGPTERRVSVIRVEPPAVDPDAGAAFDPQLLARTIRSRLSEVRACYERALKRRPDIAGKLVLRFTITAAGTVSSVDIDEDTLRDPEVTACVRAAVQRWRFPAPARAGAEVSFPFVFQPAA